MMQLHSAGPDIPLSLLQVHPQECRSTQLGSSSLLDLIGGKLGCPFVAQSAH